VPALLLQWGLAFGQCLRLAAPAEGFAVEICTPYGIHRVVMPLGESEEAPRHAAQAIACPACLGPAAAALTPPEVTLGAPVVLAQAAPPSPPPQPGAPQIPPRSCQPRAPPTS
jgi:hypothetical protein